jgi:tetratricopeptide (TPR) repeat protein
MQITIYRPSLYHAVVLPIAFLALVAALGFLRYTTDVQTHELQFRLNALSLRESAVDASDLLVRLTAEQSQNSNALRPQQLPVQELQNLAAFGEHTQPAEYAEGETAAAQLVRRVIAALQRLAGIDPPGHIYAANGVDLLTIGYNLERRRYFAEALVTFRKVIGQDARADVDDFARLHAGYCLFFLGEYALARSEWQTTQTTGMPQNQRLASRLIAWLEAFEKQRTQAARLANARRRAESLYGILAYKESLEALLAVAEHGRDPGYHYLRGRVYEGPGKFEAAAEEYARTLALAPTSGAAQLANRRLLLMGSFYRNDKRLTEAATKRAQLLGDTGFLAVLGQLGKSTNAADTSIAGDAVYRQILATENSPPVAALVRTVRVRTHDGAVITGRLTASNATHVVIVNESGRLRIPRSDISSQENVSGK